MRAIGVIEFGGPDALQVVDLPLPEAGPGEIRIQVLAATVNPTDAGLRNGTRAEMLKDVPKPHVPGMDIAGVVDQVGEDTSTELAVGDDVMAIVIPNGPHGAYAEYVVVPAESVTRIPAGADHAQAATLPMNGLTTVQALDLLDLQPGDYLAVTGGAGAVGGYAIQLGKIAGLIVVADASPADEELVRGLGADHIVPRGEDFAAAVRAIVAEGAHGVVDSALLNQDAEGAVRDGGRIATVRGFVGESDRGVSFHPVSVRNYARENAKLDQLRQQVEDGQVTLRVADTLAAEHAPEAHRRLEAGGVRGRLVLTF
jgi:NADPH2:quinone reductase